MSESRTAAVLLSTTRHPSSGVPCAAHNDVVALQIARSLGLGPPRAVHYGDGSDPALQDYLAFGAARIRVLPPDPQLSMAQVLARELADAAVVLCGCRAESGEASGLLPFELGKALDCPVMTDVLEVLPQPQGLAAVQFLPRGRRRRVDLPCPAVLAIHPLAPATPRYAYARRLMGVIESRRSVASVPLTTESPAVPSEWQLEAQARPPLRLKGLDHRSGHARMTAAVAQVARGGQVISEGTSRDMARAILSYMRRHGLTRIGQ
jgi:electron transfer flavoprotein beta subunit